MPVKLLLGLFFFLLFLSCHSDKLDQYQHRPSAHLIRKNSGQLAVPQIRLTPRQYRYEVTSRQTAAVTINDQKRETSQELYMRFGYMVQPLQHNAQRMDMQYEQIRIRLQAPEEEPEEMSSEQPLTAFHSVTNLLHDIKAARLSLVIDSNRRLTRMDGKEALMASVMKGMEHFTDAERGKIKQLVSEFTGDRYVQSGLADPILASPHANLRQGMEWSRQDTVESELRLIIRNTYQLRAIDDSVAVIQSTGNLATDSEEHISWQGTNIESELDGQIQGSILMNLFTGMLVEQVSAIRIKGKLFVQARSFPINIHINKKVRLLN